MRKYLLVFGVALFLAADAADNALKKDFALLQGEWSLTAAESEGQATPAEEIKKRKRNCKESETTLTADGQLLFKAKFTIDPAKKPKTIDYEVIDGAFNGMTLRGIYEVEGDTLRFCVGQPGVERPKEFHTSAGSRTFLVVWKREKK